MDKIIFFKSVLIKLSKLFKDKKPPDEIIVKDRLNASNVLKFIILNNKKIIKVKDAYKIIIFNDCFIISDELNEI